MTKKFQFVVQLNLFQAAASKILWNAERAAAEKYCSLCKNLPI